MVSCGPLPPLCPRDAKMVLPAGQTCVQLCGADLELVFGRQVGLAIKVPYGFTLAINFECGFVSSVINARSALKGP